MTAAGQLSSKEAQRSIRDTLLFAVAYAIPEILESIKLIDFGDHTTQVSVALALLVPIINRLLNIYRIKE